MVLENGGLPPPLQLYAAAAAAGGCFGPAARPVIPHFFHTAVANFSAAARSGFPVGLAGFGVPSDNVILSFESIKILKFKDSFLDGNQSSLPTDTARPTVKPAHFFHTRSFKLIID
ncbi:hypothetical protein RUM44_011180 [Polyplax serrata]|uniref:Uncharacterized protein n=1 Tax=Polyplax serrata TaxID=468196 RepID=A0ABR1APB5_POLSC